MFATGIALRRYFGAIVFFLSLYFLPNNAFIIALPNFRSTPAREVGIPVSRANFCFVCVTPKALFHENESPGIPVSVLFFTICSQGMPSYKHQVSRRNIAFRFAYVSHLNTHPLERIFLGVHRGCW